MDCFYPDCREPASHWIVRHLDAECLPNPDVRAYCDNHRVPDLQAAAQAIPATVLSIEVVEFNR
jgi:hypothetical protein